MDIQFVLDHLIKPFEYGILQQQNYSIYSKDMQIIVRLWDIRFNQQIQVFNGHTDNVNTVEYSPFVIKNSIGNSNVICSGSIDNTIRFWDIRSNKNELYVIEKDNGINCLKFLQLKNTKSNEDLSCTNSIFNDMQYLLITCYGKRENICFFNGNINIVIIT
ncbi:hypothetical protein RFI_25595 [Reticulomyxa filosa]|uniref:Uncharacterized protein n=1 Tax=Reticulomyxa filosa TaxID=46433 RepID=X6MEC9_RETFI|nr:hypothetical protein RFI_25595 [Reticulomyxa filosa]|eukprot:ETO11782.1 hypothetical protein RFI_25595 [Reticulomyxa filosa]